MIPIDSCIFYLNLYLCCLILIWGQSSLGGDGLSCQRLSDNIDISANLIDGAQIAHTDLQTSGQEQSGERDLGLAIDH